MRYVKQFGIILTITFFGEILHELLPVPIPAGIYGIVLLFSALKLRIIRVEQVKDASSFLIQIMPLMFIPAAVGLIETWGILKNSWARFSFVTVVSSVIVLAASGLATQGVIRLRSRREGRK